MTERTVFIRGERVTVDDQIDRLDQLITAGKVEAMATVARTDAGPGLTAYVLLTMGEPLPAVRHMLRHALDGIDNLIGKEKP